jgi:hypothetical protein
VVSVKMLTLCVLISILLSGMYSISNASMPRHYYRVQNKTKTRFYNFDDLLIDGKVRKPQVLYTDARQKVRFERLLKLKRNFLPKLKDTRKDPALR